MSGFTILAQDVPEQHRTGIWRYTDEVSRRLARSSGANIVTASFHGPHGPLWSRYYGRLFFKKYLIRPRGRLHSMCMWLIPPGTEICTIWDLIPLFREGMPLADRIVYRDLARSIVQYPSEWVAISEPVRQQLIGRLGIPGKHVHVAPPGIDRGLFHPTGEGRRAGGRTVVLHVGIGYPRKRIDLVIEALALLGPERFQFVRIGPAADKAYVASCLQRAGEVGLDMVELGRVPDATLVEWYNRADVMVFPSTDEVAGMPPIEALACGTNVVVSDIPPHRYLCGDLAWYAKPGDAQDLANAIERALAAPISEGDLMAHAARFSWDATAQVYADLYHSCGRGRM
jgi:glycosyltransferase involved in cell wall biosynthesis